MSKNVNISLMLLLSVFFYGSIVLVAAQTTSADTNQDQQVRQLTYELNNLKNTKNLLIEYIDYLKPELNLLAKIDSTIVRNVDMTFDGKPEIISIQVTGQSILHPFTWKLEIVSEGKTIFSHESKDDWIDHFFGSEESWISDRHGLDKSQGLNRYIQEKSFYYFNILLERSIQKSTFEKDNRMFSKEFSGGGGIYVVFPEQLKKMGIMDEKLINKIIENAIKRLQAGTNTLGIFITPLQMQAPRIFVPEVNSFLIFYQA